MELDDLRRQWRQPEPAVSTPFTPIQLGALLTQQRGGVVEKMRRSARWEMGLMLVVAVFTIGFLPYVPELGLLPYLMLVLALGLLYYYYQVLDVLRKMTETTGNVRSHLGLLCTGLRQLLRFNYRLTLRMVPITLVTVLGLPLGRELIRIGQELLHHKQLQWGRLPLLVVIVLAVGGLMQLVVVPVTRWNLQRLYGQHLDRLEGQLRELEGVEPPAGSGSTPHFTA